MSKPVNAELKDKCYQLYKKHRAEDRSNNWCAERIHDYLRDNGESCTIYTAQRMVRDWSILEKSQSVMIETSDVNVEWQKDVLEDVSSILYAAIKKMKEEEKPNLRELGELCKTLNKMIDTSLKASALSSRKTTQINSISESTQARIIMNTDDNEDIS